MNVGIYTPNLLKKRYRVEKLIQFKAKLNIKASFIGAECQIPRNRHKVISFHYS